MNDVCYPLHISQLVERGSAQSQPWRGGLGLQTDVLGCYGHKQSNKRQFNDFVIIIAIVDHVATTSVLIRFSLTLLFGERINEAVRG